MLLSIVYNIVITLLIASNTAIRLKKTAKYRRLRKQTVTFFILLKEEFEISDDDFVKQLWEENQRLENEVKVLKKDFNKISLFSVLMLIMFYIGQKFKPAENN